MPFLGRFAWSVIWFRFFFFNLSPETQEPARDRNSSWNLPEMQTVWRSLKTSSSMYLYLSRKLWRRIFQETVPSQETSCWGSRNSFSVFLGLCFLKGKGNSVKNVKQGQRYKYILKALNKKCLKALLQGDFSVIGAKQGTRFNTQECSPSRPPWVPGT